jgi:hypothetical protein
VKSRFGTRLTRACSGHGTSYFGGGHRVRSFVAIVAGAGVAAGLYQVGAIVALLATVGLPLGAPGGEPPAAYYVLNLGLAAVAAALGGAVSARAARGARQWVVPLLAILLAGAALWGFSQPASQWPRWYPLALALVGAGGTLVGGQLWPRRAA